MFIDGSDCIQSWPFVGASGKHPSQGLDKYKKASFFILKGKELTELMSHWSMKTSEAAVIIHRMIIAS